jgi:hypothetical protein
MAQASVVITSARYDLRDPNSTQYSDAELLDYLNRGMLALDALLASLGSDFVIAKTTAALLAAATSVALPASFISMRSAYIDTNYPLVKLTPEEIYSLQDTTSANKPTYYSFAGANIIFDCAADVGYTVNLIYNSRSTALAATTSAMPHNDEFNQILREFAVFSAKHRNEYDLTGNAATLEFFRSYCMSKVVSRNKTYAIKLGF